MALFAFDFLGRIFFPLELPLILLTGLPVKILIANLKIDICIIANGLFVFSICRLLSCVVHLFFLPAPARASQTLIFLIEENGNNNKKTLKTTTTHTHIQLTCAGFLIAYWLIVIDRCPEVTK